MSSTVPDDMNKELEAAYEELIETYSKGDFLGRKHSRKNMYSDQRGVFREDGSAVKRYDTCTLCMAAPERGQRFMRCSGCVQENGDGTTYCSQKCQRLHWPDHKLRCKHAQEDRKKLELLSSLSAVPPIMLRGNEFKAWNELNSWVWTRATHRGVHCTKYGLSDFDYDKVALLIHCKSRPESETGGNPALFADVEKVEFSKLADLERPKWDLLFERMPAMFPKRKRIEQLQRARLGNGHRGVVWTIFIVDGVMPLTDVHGVSAGPNTFKKTDHSDWVEDMQRYIHNGWVMRRIDDKDNSNYAVGKLSKRRATWHWTRFSASECQRLGLAREYRDVFQDDPKPKRR